MMHFSSWKYTLLLASMILLMTMRFAFGGSEFGHLFTNVGVVVVVMTSLAAASTRAHSRILAFVLGFPILAVTAWSLFEYPHPSHQIFVMQRASMTIFLAFTTVTILQDLIDQRQITRDTLVGALCGYLLLGVIGTELFCWIDLVSPNSYSIASPAASEMPPETRWNQMQYFSFVTLSTLGYGDILPMTPLTRILACLEAICGQFYLAVLVAGLVSVRVGQLGPPSQFGTKQVEN